MRHRLKPPTSPSSVGQFYQHQIESPIDGNNPGLYKWFSSE
jgi:hypothetical protein